MKNIANQYSASRSTHARRITGITILVLVVVAAALFAYFHKVPTNQSGATQTPALNTQDKPVGQTDYSQATKEQQNAATDTTAPTSPTEARQNTSNPIPVSISYLGGAPLQVRVLIGELMQNGLCKLTIEKAGVSPVVQTVDVFPSASSTTCKGFTIDTSSLAKGPWTVTVTVTQGDRTGTASKEVTL